MLNSNTMESSFFLGMSGKPHSKRSNPIGDIQRVYRGPNLEYKGWQTASYCRPESVFERPDETFGPWKIKGSSLQCDCSPEASFEKLRDHVLTLFPGADAKAVLKVLG